MRSFAGRTGMAWAGLRLRTKLLLSYLLLILLALGVLALLNYERFSSILTRHTIYTAHKNFEQTHSYLHVLLDKALRTSDIAMSNADLQQLLSGKPGSAEQEMDRLLLAGQVFRDLEALQDDKDIVGFGLYLLSDNPYIDIGYAFENLEEAADSVWYRQLMESPGKALWAPPAYLLGGGDGIKLSLFRIVRDSADLQRNVGVLRVDFNAETVGDILRNSTTFENGVSFIRNGNHIPVIASGEGEQLDWSAITAISSALGSYKRDNFIRFGGESYFYFSQPFDNSDWTLTTLIPYRSVFGETIRLRNEIIMLIVCIAIGASGFAIYLAHTMTKRITALTHQMRKVKIGQLSTIRENDRADQDEIGKLTRDFHMMLAEISSLMNERYQAGIVVKNAELRALQAQINPHFLYNTLDMINWLSQSNRSADVEQAVKSLATFYKLSLNQGKDEILIRDELEHVQHYVLIQNMRFDHRIMFVEEVEEAVKDCLIQKLTLQPLVENAILHGIMKKPSREGTIFIEGAMTGNVIVIRVEDDGVGMAEKRIPLSESRDRNPGYGARNVRDRIRLAYGESYGIVYSSEPGRGTSVAIRLPAREPENGDR